MNIQFQSAQDVKTFVYNTSIETLKGLYASSYLSGDEKQVIRDCFNHYNSLDFEIASFNDGVNVWELSARFDLDDISKTKVLRTGFGASEYSLDDLTSEQQKAVLQHWVTLTVGNPFLNQSIN